MASSKRRPKFYYSILQVLLVVNLLLFVLCTAWIFITSDTCGVYVYGSLAIYGLLNAVGITLIHRRHKIGLWICTVGFVIECISLLIWGYPVGNIMPYVVIGSVIMFITAPLFICKAQSSDTIIWNNMLSGLDIKHSRHIYQLTSILIVGIVVIICFYKPTTQPTVISKTEETTVKLPREITYSLLDSANITLNEVTVIEGMIESIPSDQQQKYNRRIFALKHILLSGLMTDKHNTLNFCNICKIHTGDFSTDQQKILDWYTSLSKSEQEIWLDCPSVDNLSSFENEVKQRILSNKK